jgi:hypothetical protein
MSTTLPSEEIRKEYEKFREMVSEEDGLNLVDGYPSVDTRVHLHDYSFEEVVDLGKRLGQNTFYAVLEEDDEGDPEWARVSFFQHGVAHVRYVESEKIAEIREEETEDQLEEAERKEELAEEILEGYSDLLSAAEEYRLKNNLDDMRMDRLFSLQDRLEDEKKRKEKEEKIDEDLEEELAETLADEERFNRQFNEIDTEMLLNELDVEFDDEAVRIREVHRRAKALLKIRD